MKDGGPAFPRPRGCAKDETDTMLYNDAHKGMTLRQWYAGMALQGLLASGLHNNMGGIGHVRTLANEYADAMLKEGSHDQ